jgi:serine/threonine protein kinase
MMRGIFVISAHEHSLIYNYDRVDLPWERRLSMAKDTAKGMTFLHTSNPPTLHNDLKSQNLLVSQNWVCKVSDFGMTTLKGARTQVNMFYHSVELSIHIFCRTSYWVVFFGWLQKF